MYLYLIANFTHHFRSDAVDNHSSDPAYVVDEEPTESPVILVIENTEGLTNVECDAFAQKFKKNESVPLDPTIKHKVESVSVLELKQSGLQYYEAFDLHERPHYMIACSKLQINDRYGDIPVNEIPCYEPTADEIGFQNQDWFVLKDLVLQEGRKNIRGNIVLTKGSSGQNMRVPRSEGGRPGITTSYMSDNVAQLVTPLLEYLTEKAAQQGCTPRGGELFANELCPNNFYEAVAVAVTRGPDVAPHMDRENDNRPGHNIMGAITFSGSDAHGYFRVGVFGYTRKCVGDFLENA